MVSKEASREAIHHNRRHLTIFVFLPLQQHLSCISSAIDIESELMQFELLICVLSKPLVVPPNIKYGGECKPQHTKWQPSEF